MSEQPKDLRTPDGSDSATAPQQTPQQTWRTRSPAPRPRNPAPVDVVEGLRTLYG